jgi:hypothetical protein
MYDVRAAAVGKPPLVTTGTLEILHRDWPLDSSLAQRDLGYTVTPLAEGIERTLRSLGVDCRSGAEHPGSNRL